MSDDALLATMTELTTYLNLRDEHRAAIEEATGALVKLEGEIARLREELLGHLHDYALSPIPLPAATPEQVVAHDPVAFLGDPAPAYDDAKLGAPKKMGRPKGSKDKQPRKAGSGGYRGRAPRPVREIASPPAMALETIKASGPEGVPADKLHVKPWVFGQLARTHKARKLPNGNWVAA